MSSSVGMSILVRVAQEVKSSPERQFSTIHGEMLVALPVEDLQLLQAASELIARNLVILVTAVPSRRSFYRVESVNKYRKRDEDVNVSFHSGTQPFDESMASGNGANYYNCFDHYCTCAVFHETVVMTHSTAMCKHMVARLLADATGQFQTMQVKDACFAQMLCPIVKEDTNNGQG